MRYNMSESTRNTMNRLFNKWNRRAERHFNHSKNIKGRRDKTVVTRYNSYDQSI